MKINLIIVIGGFMCLISSAQKDVILPQKDTQIKIIYSIEYPKLPFKMKMIKKMLPKEAVSYYSEVGNRMEMNTRGKIMGQHIVSSTIIVQNYVDSIMVTKVTALVNDSIMDDVFHENTLPKPSLSEILFEEKKKDILGYPCVYFIHENDSIKTEGFLTLEIDGINEFKNYGMPLDYKTTNKYEKSIIITKAKNILIESLDESKFIISD